jgi:catechol 2,3-dioxygenase-like lactoylglutathione lyase family enzyme
MLGQFLEFSVNAPQLASSLDFYRSLGFRDFRVGDILHGPYAVIGDADMAIGLRSGENGGPVLTFVRPGLRDHLRAFKRRRIGFEFTQLDDDQFHEAAFADPNGQRVRLIEARTCSPPASTQDNVTGCGQFLEYSVATRSAEESAAFWQCLGFTRAAEGGEPAPWIRVAGCGAVLGFHEGARFRSGITFGAASLGARLEYLRAKRFEPARGVPFGRPGGTAATLSAPEGTPLYLLETAPDQD